VLKSYVAISNRGVSVEASLPVASRRRQRVGIEPERRLVDVDNRREPPERRVHGEVQSREPKAQRSEGIPLSVSCERAEGFPCH